MPIRKWVTGLAAVNGFSLSLMRRNPAALRPYISHVARIYHDLTGDGLKGKFPLEHLYEIEAATFDPAARIQFPAILYGGGGTSTEELLHLAAITQVLQP